MIKKKIGRQGNPTFRPLNWGRICKEKKKQADPCGAKNVPGASGGNEATKQEEKKRSQEFIQVLQSKEKSASEKNFQYYKLQ